MPSFSAIGTQADLQQQFMAEPRPGGRLDPWTELTDQERHVLDYKGRSLIIPIIRERVDHGWKIPLQGTPVLALYDKGLLNAADVSQTEVRFERTGKGMAALRLIHDEGAARAAAERARNEAHPLWGMF